MKTRLLRLERFFKKSRSQIMKYAAARRSQASQDERGGVLVLVAVTLPVLILIGSFTVDVANWWVHKRHLQTQADAAALGAAAGFTNCNNQRIRSIAATYSGSETASHNQQIGNTPTGRVHMRVNSPTFHGQSAVDPDISGSPCDTQMIDVKVTETDVPWFFRVANVDFINAQARVSVFKIKSTNGLLPFGVPDPTAKRAKVVFIDEGNNGAVLGERELQKGGNQDGSVIWDNSGEPLSLAVNSERIGVRVVLSKTDSLTCGDQGVQCLDLGSDNGIGFIRGWSATPSVSDGDTPQARNVALLPGGCSDGYFISDAADCHIGISADVDFATDSGGLGNQRVAAVVDGQEYALSFDATAGVWRASNLRIPADVGPIPVTLKWEQTGGSIGGESCSSDSGNLCVGSFGVVQRAFSANQSRSGLVNSLEISDQDGPGANSIERCSLGNVSCTRDFVVRIGVPSLAIAKPTDSPITLRVGGGGSQNQTIDCDPGLSNLQDEIAYGCGPTYERNTGTDCPASQATLWGTSEPWDCIATQTGAAVNQVPKGLNQRILCESSPGNCDQFAKPDTCTQPNNWPNFTADDPRIVSLFIVPFGTFDASGNAVYPVDEFAFFYVTGWVGSGAGFSNPCKGNGDDPIPGNTAGYMVGHYIKYVKQNNSGGSTGEPCDLSSIGGCVAVLTK